MGIAALAFLVLTPAAVPQTCPAEEARFTPAEVGDQSFFGTAIGVDDSGSVAVCGARYYDDLGPGSGAAWVFERSGSDWVEVAMLQAFDGAGGDAFGFSVAIDGGGDRAIVCTERNGSGGGTSIRGRAYAFERQGRTWVADGELVAPDAPVPFGFGQDVALDADGDTAIVGAFADPQIGTAGGAAFVFVNGPGGWELEEKLLPSDRVGGIHFGWTVALSADGDRAFAGAKRADGWHGAVYAFERSGAVWSQSAKLTGADLGSLSQSGYSLTTNAAGDRVATGAIGDAGFTGAVYVFSSGPSGWAEEAKLVAADPTDVHWFGAQVALDAAGDTLAVTTTSVIGTAVRSLFLLERDPAWAEVAEVVPTDGDPGDFFGYEGVATDAAGDRILVPALSASAGGVDRGAVYVYRADGVAPTAYCTAKSNSQDCPTAIAGAGTPSASDPAPFVIGASPVINRKNGILFYGVLGRAALPLSGGVLCAAPPLRRTGFQHSFGSPPPAVDCTGAYTFDFNAWIQSGVDPFLVAGRIVNAQYWWRDPAQPDGTGVVLTDALEFGLCP